jgi:hypothetical protein
VDQCSWPGCCLGHTRPVFIATHLPHHRHRRALVSVASLRSDDWNRPSMPCLPYHMPHQPSYQQLVSTPVPPGLPRWSWDNSVCLLAHAQPTYHYPDGLTGASVHIAGPSLRAWRYAVSREHGRGAGWVRLQLGGNLSHQLVAGRHAGCAASGFGLGYRVKSPVAVGVALCDRPSP